MTRINFTISTEKKSNLGLNLSRNRLIPNTTMLSWYTFKILHRLAKKCTDFKCIHSQCFCYRYGFYKVLLSWVIKSHCINVSVFCLLLCLQFKPLSQCRIPSKKNIEVLLSTQVQSTTKFCSIRSIKFLEILVECKTLLVLFFFLKCHFYTTSKTKRSPLLPSFHAKRFSLKSATSGV